MLGRLSGCCYHKWLPGAGVPVRTLQADFDHNTIRRADYHSGNSEMILASWYGGRTLRSTMRVWP